jgi:hypothetical protein
MENIRLGYTKSPAMSYPVTSAQGHLDHNQVKSTRLFKFTFIEGYQRGVELQKAI